MAPFVGGGTTPSLEIVPSGGSLRDPVEVGESRNAHVVPLALGADGERDRFLPPRTVRPGSLKRVVPPVLEIAAPAQADKAQPKLLFLQRDNGVAVQIVLVPACVS